MSTSNFLGLQPDAPAQRPPSGGLLVPGQVTIPQGARLPTPIMSGVVTMPPPVPPSSVTSSQDTPPPRFPPTQPGLIAAPTGPLGIVGPPRPPPGPIRPPGPPPQSLRPPLIPPGPLRPPGPPGPPPSGALQPPGPPVTPPAASPGLLGIPGTIKPPAIPNFQLGSQPTIQASTTLTQQPQPRPQLMTPPPGEPFWIEHKSPDGKAYYSNPITHETTWQRPANVLVRPGPPFVTPTSQPFVTPTSQPFVTPTSQPFVPISQPSSSSTPPQLPFPQSSSGAMLVPTKVWSEHKNSEGKVYYYNKITLQSVWEKPKDFDLILPMPVAMASTGPANDASSGTTAATASGTAAVAAGSTEGDAQKDESVQQQQQQQQQESGDALSSLQAAILDQPLPIGLPPSDGDTPTEVQKDSTTTPGDGKVESMETESVPPPTAITANTETPAEKGKEKPVTSAPVSGTPWSIVWTSDGRVFFFNATQRKSYWQIPIELEKNKKVREMLDPSERKPEKRPGEVIVGVDIKRPHLDEVDSDDEPSKNVVPDNPPPPVLAEIPEKTVHVKAALKEIDKMQQEAKAAEMRARMTLEERQQEFTKMMLERGVSAFSTWEKELPKIVFDPRYNYLNPKERKQAYDSFILTRAEDERKEKKAKLKEIRDAYRKMMEEFKVTPRTLFTEFSHKCSKDERFQAIEKSRERETLFEEYRSELKKQSRKSEQTRRESVPTPKTISELRMDYFAMLSENKSLHYKSKWKDVKSSFRQDPRYQAVEHSSQREEWFQEHVKKLEKHSEKHKKEKRHSQSSKEEEKEDMEKARKERMEASLKERELEVQRSRSAQEKEWDREKDHLRKMEATSQFKALLADLVRQSTASWHATKKTLKKDSRWELTELLDSSDKEKMFRSHVSVLAEKKKKQFQKLLEDTSEITLVTSWKKARKLIKKDPRYELYGEDDKEREAEYERFRKEKRYRCKEEFKNLLRETKCITYRSKGLIKESDKHMREILDVLKNDQRFLVMDCIGEEREDILLDYISDLEVKGPPPPPTATNPLERLRRI